VSRPTIALVAAQAARVGRLVRLGHPWIYDRALPASSAAFAPGAIAIVVDADGAALGCAFVDPTSPLRARLLDREPAASLDEAWVARRTEAAARRRALLPELAVTDAVRAVHGENDGAPGLTVDVYAGVAVVVFDGEAAAAFWRPRVDAALAGLRAGGIAIHARWIRAVRGAPRGEPASGDGGPEVTIREHAAHFVVDVRAGQKTGFFLDQRANRARVASLSARASVLNLCAYTGGFSVACGLAGATAVTSVDLAPAAIAAADAHWRRNQLPPGGHLGVVADCFDFLQEAVAARRLWDVTIVDPPSFAASEAVKPRGLLAYQRLNRDAIAVTRRGGLLVSASCSSHVTEADLRGVLAAAAAEVRRGVRVIEARGAAGDHPTLPGFPEGRYLKLLIAVVDA